MPEAGAAATSRRAAAGCAATPSGFAKLALAERGLLRQVQGLNGMHRARADTAQRVTLPPGERPEVTWPVATHLSRTDSGGLSQRLGGRGLGTSVASDVGFWEVPCTYRQQLLCP